MRPVQVIAATLWACFVFAVGWDQLVSRIAWLPRNGHYPMFPWSYNRTSSWNPKVHAKPSVDYGRQTHRTSTEHHRVSVRSGSLAYLIMGEGYPYENWIRRSRWQNTCVLYLSWKVNVTQALLDKSITSPTFHSFYFPNSTWATGRNHHLQLTRHVEVNQGWKFEFLVFADEDVYLDVRELGHFNVKIKRDNDDFAFRRFYDLLLRDRPLIASVSYPSEPIHGANDNVTCVQRCHFDNMIVAVHRTAVDFLPPYDPSMDSLKWWSAAYMRNIYLSVFVPEHCNLYRELATNFTQQKHGDYPRTGLNDYTRTKLHAARHLAKLGIPGKATETTCCRITKLLKEQEKRVLGPVCQAHGRGVDFTVLAAGPAKWLRRLAGVQSQLHAGAFRKPTKADKLRCCADA
eukprot:scpid67192/ scgid15569/ 